MSTNYASDVITSGSTEDTITISNNTLDDIMNSVMNSTMNSTYLITTSSTSGTSGTGINYGTYSTAQTLPHALDVKGDANFEGDIKFKGRSLEELFSKIEDRLAILQPDPAKLDKYESLRKAYNHYKMLEKLIGDD